MASIVNVVNHTATGNVDTLTIPKSCSVSIHGRTTEVLVYDAAAGSEYYTIPSGSSLAIAAANMTGDNLYLKATAGAVIEICYQTDR